MKRDLRKLKDRAIEWSRKGKFSKALDAYLSIGSEEPGNPRWPHKAGEMHQKLGHSGEAVDAYQEAAWRYAEQGFLLKAIAMCKLILGLDPDHKDTQNMLATLYARQTGRPRAPTGLKPPPAQPPAQSPAQPPDQPPAQLPDQPAALPAVQPPVEQETIELAEVTEIPISVDESPDRISQPETIELPEASPARIPPPLTHHRQLRDEPAPGAAPIDIGVKIPIGESLSQAQLDPHTKRTLPPDMAQQKLHRKRTLPPGMALDAVKLGELVSEARKHVPEEQPGQIYEIPLEEDLDAAFGETFTDEQPGVETPTPDLPEIPPTPLFSSLDPDALRLLIEKVQMRQFEPGERIITQGEQGSTLYVVVEGEVAVFREAQPRRELGRLGEGAFFGEIALLTSFDRTSTVEAASETTVIEISRELISDLIEDHPDVLKVLLRFFRDRLIDTLIETSEMFAPFVDQEREALASRFTFLEGEPDTVFTREGEPSDGLYILLSGKVDGLLPGDMFGANSLLTEENEMSTYRAKSKCWLLKMDRQTFREVIMTHPQVLAFVSDVAEQRRQALANASPFRESATSVEIRLDLI